MIKKQEVLISDKGDSRKLSFSSSLLVLCLYLCNFVSIYILIWIDWFSKISKLIEETFKLTYKAQDQQLFSVFIKPNKELKGEMFWFNTFRHWRGDALLISYDLWLPNHIAWQNMTVCIRARPICRFAHITGQYWDMVHQYASIEKHFASLEKMLQLVIENSVIIKFAAPHLITNKGNVYSSVHLSLE